MSSTVMAGKMLQKSTFQTGGGNEALTFSEVMAAVKVVFGVVVGVVVVGVVVVGVVVVGVVVVVVGVEGVVGTDQLGRPTPWRPSKWTPTERASNWSHATSTQCTVTAG